MKSVVLLLHRQPVAQEIKRLLGTDPYVTIHYTPDPTEARERVRADGANVVVMEAPTETDEGIERCLKFCRSLRDSSPAVKLLLICPEQSRDLIREAVRAKKDGQIDDFLFCDSSVEYIAAKLSSLSL